MSGFKLKLCAVITVLPAMVNCSKVDFAPSSGTKLGTVVDNNDGTVTGHITQPGGTPVPTPNPTPTPTPTPIPTSSLPKLQFISPPCVRLTNCSVTFRLDKAYAQSTEFDWRTNDTLYLTPHTPVYAQPSVHYVSTGGHVVFQAGETSKTVYIQNVNKGTNEVIIGVVLSACKFNTQAQSCAGFFPDI